MQAVLARSPAPGALVASPPLPPSRNFTWKWLSGVTKLGLDYHGHLSPAVANLRAGYSVTPLRYTFEMGGKSKMLPRQRGRAAAAGLQISQSRKKISAGIFFSRERNLGC